MPRQLRLQYPGALYHVLNRGDRRQPSFADDRDRRRFLETVGEACQKTGWQVHAYGLRSHHLHLVVETPQPNLSAARKWFLGTYTNPIMTSNTPVAPLGPGIAGQRVLPFRPSSPSAPAFPVVIERARN
jgi:REP element-mobilizing transposase RayT